MSNFSATAIAHPNIAFIKYWGNQSDDDRIPLNGSISMNLDGLLTMTQVNFQPELTHDRFILNGQHTAPAAERRVSDFLDHIRALAHLPYFAEVTSTNNFPAGAGIASSAAAFAALALAGSSAAGLHLSEKDLSRLARLGSGSACRSVPAGFVEWLPGEDDTSSYAVSIAPPSYWDLCDCIAVVSSSTKKIGSTEGHHLASTSPLQAGRVADAPRRLDICRQALLSHDFDSFAKIVEQDSNLMHAVMMTSEPPLFYWQPASLLIMQKVNEWRISGLPVCYTLDAGPNVHVLCESFAAARIQALLAELPGINQIFIAHPGEGARLVNP